MTTPKRRILSFLLNVLCHTMLLMSKYFSCIDNFFFTSTGCEDKDLTCWKWKTHCSTYVHVQKKCPLTCQLCCEFHICYTFFQFRIDILTSSVSRLNEAQSAYLTNRPLSSLVSLQLNNPLF